MAKRNGRIYWRNGRAYGDFRDYADVGGRREALKPEGGSGRATDDPDIAGRLSADRVEELDAKRRGRQLHGIEREATLREYVPDYLVAKAKAGRSRTHLAQLESRLTAAMEFFGEDRDLAAISVDDVERWADHLGTVPNGRDGTYGPGTIRHYLNALSGLYTRAQSKRYVRPGFNPVVAMPDKPTGNGRAKPDWLEVHEAALIIEAAGVWHGARGADSVPFLGPLVATFMLTGGRKNEVLGLAVDDVSFDRKIVTFQPNEYRGLKTRTSHRPVPLWPQLEAILREYIFGGSGPRSSGLLFPSPINGGKLDNVDRALDHVGGMCGYGPKEIRTKMFRHTYCTARLQTLDRGAAVSPWTVGREMGHGGTSLVDRVYGHLGDIRHRSDQVEFIPDDHAEKLGGRLAVVRAWTPPPERCQYVHPDGRRCGTTRTINAAGWCHWHDPDRARERRRKRADQGVS